MESKHTSADSPQAGTYGQEVTDRETSDLRRFRQGDGEIMIPPGEVVLLDYVCAACGRAYEIALQASSRPTLIDCNEERLCDGCQKKDLVTMLLERGTTVPEERLLTMTVEELLTLASASALSGTSSAESGRSRSSDFHCNERHERDHRYNRDHADPDSCLEYGPDRFTSRCHCAYDNNREDKQDVARRH